MRRSRRCTPSSPETRDKAFVAGRKAAELEPGNLFYATNYGYVLANAGKTGEAKALATRIQEVAKTPVERDSVQQLPGCDRQSRKL